MTTNIVTAKFCNSRRTTTRPLTQYDYGQILRIEGIDLPDAYEVDFSNNQYTGDSKPQLGDASGVAIPEEYIKTGKDIYAFIYLHAGESDGETFYWIKIPNELRPARTEETPTPEEQSIIDQTIAALNTGVQKVEDIADGLEEQIDTALQEAKDSGEFDGEDGFSPEITIKSITGGHHITIVDAEGSSSFDVMNGVDGEDGKGIVSVEKTGTAGLVDTYTITYTDGTTTTFTVTNGKDGVDGKDGKDGIDGISPTATVSQTSTGARITIIDKDGTTTADVNNGTNGVTFTPNVSSEGIISWTNNAGLPNPESRDIRGPRGEPGSGVSIHICSSSEYDAVTRVPTVQNPDTNTFYLVPAEDAASPDMFVEWIFTNNAWEMFGSATVEVPVQDVQVNGTSVLGQDGVANVPVSALNVAGVASVNSDYGTTANTSGRIAVSKASSTNVKDGVSQYKPIVPYNQHESTFYGLAKAAGDTTQSSSSNAVGNYTETALTKIHAMLSPKYRLIKEVTIAGSDTAFILIDSDTNGNPFSLFDVIIDFDMTATGETVNSNGLIYPNVDSDPGNNGQNLPFLSVSALFSNSAQRKVARLHVDGGRLVGDSDLSSFTNHYALVYFQHNRNASGLYECEPISKLRIWSINGHKFGNGSVIKVYGR